MKKTYRWIWGTLEFIIIIYVVLMTSLLLSKNKYGYTQIGKYTLTSIEKEDTDNIKGVKSGDLLVIYQSDTIKKGDTIYYYVVVNESYKIQGDKVVDLEKDDYNSIYSLDRDGMLTVTSSRVLGKKKTVYHGLGSVLDMLESRLGFLFLVLLPILIVFIYQVYELFILFKNDKEDDGKKKKHSDK